MIRKVFFLIGMTLASHSILANENNVQSVIDAFTNCDNSFFYQLKTNASDFNDITDLVIKNDIAYIPVPDVTSYENYSYHFKKPIKYRGITITGYQNIYIETPGLGKYYYWGFLIKGTVKDVKGSLSHLSWRLFDKNSYIANAKLFDTQSNKNVWQDDPYIIGSVIPRVFTIEKALFLEQEDKQQVNLICSMQGDVNNNILNTIHPDMNYIYQEIFSKRKAKFKALAAQKKLLQVQDNKQTTLANIHNNDLISEGK